MNAPTRIIPAFDPASPDAEILEAFEFVMNEKRWYYSVCDLPDGVGPSEDEVNRRDELQIAAEKQLHGNWATTISGVIAQLTETLCHEQDLWADRGLVEQGLWALEKRRSDLDGRFHGALNAAWELVHIEWEQALAAYEKSAADFDIALNLKSLAEAEVFRRRGEGAEPDAFLQRLIDLAERLEDHFTNEPYVTRLIRTLTPDHAAYLRKVEIIIAECVTEDVAPWLARDTALLVGTIEKEG